MAEVLRPHRTVACQRRRLLRSVPAWLLTGLLLTACGGTPSPEVDPPVGSEDGSDDGSDDGSVVPPSASIRTLAKASGWREGVTDEFESVFALFEVAYDRETAEAAWRDNVGDDLGPRDDLVPAEPGVYGDLDDVDFDQQALVVWSSGESGSCPEWLAEIDHTDDTLHLERGRTADVCTDDFNPYRLVLAVDLDRLPTADGLPSVVVDGVPDGTVRIYPADA